MKIAFIAHSLSLIYHFRLPLMKALQRQGHEVVVIAPKDSKLEVKGFTHLEWKSSQSLGFFSNFLDLLRLFKLLKNAHFDLIQASAHKANTFSSLCSFFITKPYLFLLVEGRGNALYKGGVEALLIKLLYKLSFFSRAFFICVSQANASFLENLGLQRTRIEVIKSVGVDLRRFLPLKPTKSEKEAFYKKHGLNPSLLNVLMVARMLHFKGCKEYFEAAKLLKNEANFLFIGQRLDSPFYLSLKEFQSAKNICFLPPCNDMPSLYKHCEIFCLPSYTEGFAQSALEAKACGCVLALSMCEGNTELGLNAIDALYFKSKDVKDLVFTLKALLEDETLRKILVKNALVDVLQYDVDEVVLKYLKFYEKITKEAFV